MKNLIKYTIITFTAVSLSACVANTKVEEVPKNPDNKDVVETPEKNTKDDKTLSKGEVLDAIEKEINTDLIVKLPKDLLLDKGEHLTALTESSKDSYHVVFFKTNTPISINNESLRDKDDNITKIADFKVEKLESFKKASEQISFEDFEKVGGEEVDLGSGIKGYQDAGAGSVFTSWNEGRWALSTRSLTENSEKGVSLSKKAVEFLEKNTLPVPNEYGSIKLDVQGNGNLALWQEETILYTLSEVDDSIDLLKILVSLK